MTRKQFTDKQYAALYEELEAMPPSGSRIDDLQYLLLLAREERDEALARVEFIRKLWGLQAGLERSLDE